MINVQLLTHTPNPESVVASAARLCYSNSSIMDLVEKFDNDDKSTKEFISKIMQLGHYSVLEHISFTFGVEGISRACSHQLVRHRVASYSQQSQRYVKANQFEYMIPETIRNTSTISNNLNSKYVELMNQIQIFYNYCIELGIPAEDARFVLPNAALTKIIITMNARELISVFFNHRTCNRAQHEIRNVAIKMIELVKPIAPNIFSNCGPSCFTMGECSEGSMCCGKMKDTIDFFKKL